MAYNHAVESFRNKEYPMLQGKSYLDHGGATVYSRSLVDSFSQHMLSNLYGNPHSNSTPAEFSGQMVDDVREKTLRFLGADPEHYDLVFVANATAAIKLVMECFRDMSANDSESGGFDYLYHKDSHNSVVGVREVSRSHYCFPSDLEVESWLDGTHPEIDSLSSKIERLCLFAYPGQSNMTGRRLPLSWTGKLRSSEHPTHINAYSLLDAAALAMNSSLEKVFEDPDTCPDFTAISFYKIFGFPDLGGLVVRRISDHTLSWRKFFGGGTIEMVTVLNQGKHWSKEGDIHNRLEDGTLGFHNILALGCAIDVHHRLYGNMKVVSNHVAYLGRRLYVGLTSLHHSNGTPLCDIYNEAQNDYTDATIQGGTVAFNVRHPDGICHLYAHVEEAASKGNIFLRGGALCNPGGIETYLSLRLWQMKRAWSIGVRCKVPIENKTMLSKPVGVVRASLGAMSTVADVDNFLYWLAHTYLDVVQPAKMDALTTTENETKLLEQSQPAKWSATTANETKLLEQSLPAKTNALTITANETKLLEQSEANVPTAASQISPPSTKQPPYPTKAPLELQTSVNLHLDLRTGSRTKVDSRATTTADIDPEYLEEIKKLWVTPIALDRQWKADGSGNQLSQHNNRWNGTPPSALDSKSPKWPIDDRERKGLKGLWKGNKKSFTTTKVTNA